MNTKDVLTRLNNFPADTPIVVSDFTDTKSSPCCARVEGGVIVVDFVNDAIASLNQADLAPLKVAELRQKLTTLNCPDREVLFSSYEGHYFELEALRLDEGIACFDIDGVA